MIKGALVAGVMTLSINMLLAFVFGISHPAMMVGVGVLCGFVAVFLAHKLNW